MRARALLVASALALLGAPALAALPGGAGQADPVIPSFDYELRLPDPFAERVHVVVQASGLPDGPLALRLAAGEPTQVANASWAQGVLTSDVRGGRVRIELDAPIAVRAAGFALVRLDSALPRPDGAAPAVPPRVELFAPEGWGAAASPGIEGLAVFARDLRAETREAGALRVTLAYVSLPSADEWTYLERGTPHVAAQHGNVSEDVLVVRAPPAVLPGPLAVPPALAYPADSSLEELAQGVVRLHQRYRVVEVAPASAAWLREGEERYHALTSLLAANLSTTAAAESVMARARAVGDPNATLPQAPAGSITSRQKGLVAVRALDGAMREASGGRVGLADLLAQLDERASAEVRLDSADVEAAAERVAGAPLDEFFERHVYGTQWPATAPLARSADIFVRGLRAEPARAAPGEQVFAILDAVNRGTQAGAIELLVQLDGEPAGSARVELDVGERARVGAPVVASTPGDHRVQVGALQTTFRVLAGPSLRLERTATSPAEPAAGEPFTLLVYVRNDGEAPARASVVVRQGDRVLQQATPATIDGGATRAITLPMRLESAGLHALDVEMQSDAGEGLISHEVNVQLSGTRAQDAPAPGTLAVLGVALVALLLGRAARRR